MQYLPSPFSWYKSFISTPFVLVSSPCICHKTISLISERFSVQAPHIVTITLLTLSLVALGTGLILPVLQLQLKLIYTIVVAPLNHIAFNIARGSALACDLGIVAALCWLLGLRKTDVKRANNMINWLILIAVQRGVLQAIIQMGEVLAVSVPLPFVL